jgi:pimeloyl-ACP methyl ester carboxylesterase
MGGAAVIASAMALGDQLSSAVLWAPDPSVDSYEESEDWSEEGGERVQARYWREAHHAGLIDQYRQLQCPTMVFVPTDDIYVSAENQRSLVESAGPHHRVVPLEGWVHSGWSHDQATLVIGQSVTFLAAGFGR